MKTYGVGIVGTGWVSGEHIKAFESDPRAKVLAMCGRSKDKAALKLDECGVKGDAYDDYDAMLAQEDIHIIGIATPPHVHREHTVKAAEAGKHIMLEKAMATTLDDCRAIRDAVAKAGVKTVVSFVLRWNPLFDIIKAQLAQKSLGDLIYGEVDYFHGIGPWYKQYAWNVTKEVGASSLLSAGCHSLDALRYFMGGEIAEVVQYATDIRGDSFKEYQYAPTTVTILKFKDGRIGKVTSCIACVQPYTFNINLVGTEGTIKNNQLYSSKQFPGQTHWATIPTILPDSGDVTHHPFTGEAVHLLDCIDSGKESHANIADAYITHEAVFAADMSGEKGGQPVKLPLA